MDNKFGLNLKRFRPSWLLACLVAFVLIGVVVSMAIRKSDSVSAQTVYVSQNITTANFTSEQNFSLQAEQDEDAPLKIVDVKVDVVSGDQYQQLTSERTMLGGGYFSSESNLTK